MRAPFFQNVAAMTFEASPTRLRGLLDSIELCGASDGPILRSWARRIEYARLWSPRCPSSVGLFRCRPAPRAAICREWVPPRTVPAPAIRAGNGGATRRYGRGNTWSVGLHACVHIWVRGRSLRSRRQILLDEADAIGTAYLRAGMLPDRREEIRALLRDYVDTRLQAVQSNSIAEGIRRSEQLQGQLWSHTVVLGERNPGSIVVGLSRRVAQ